MDYHGKSIAVLGLGESGEAAAGLLVRLGARVTVLDSADPEKLKARIERLQALGVRVVSGPEAETDPTVYDLGILSPGIDPVVPLVCHFVGKGIGMIGELELSYSVCACPVVAITGTNGKTTTTELVARMFNACGFRTVAAGNISPAFASAVERSPELDVMTLEVSSFQLEEIRTFRPRISVWLNLTPDHLDRYPSLEAYRAAKLRVFENQTEEDFAVVSLTDELPPLKARRITFSPYKPGGDFELRGQVIHFRGEPVLDMSQCHLGGLHNAENLMAALGVGFAWGLTFEKMGPALCSYKPLPHRCELIRVVEGVDYVNDSKATNLDSLEKALLSETRPVILIAGGKDKGFEFESIAGLVGRKARLAVLIGEMADRIERSWGRELTCKRAGSLAEAVEIARANAKPGEVVLFSPGTSSFDMFKNYADRGNQFRTLVNAL